MRTLSLLLSFFTSVAAFTPRGLHARSSFSTVRQRAIVADASATAPAEETELLALLEGSTRGKGLSAADKEEVFRLAASLEQHGSAAGAPDTNESPLLPGRWRVLFQGKPGADVEFLSAESWKNYLSGDGPSPIQNLVSGSGSVNRLYQVVELGDGPQRVNNVVDLSPRAVIAIEADLEGKPQPRRLGFRFTGGRVLLRTLWQGTLSLPYPVPFDLLGDNAKGWLQTDYLSSSLRLSRGNKGSLFVLVPESEPDDPELENLLQPPPPPPPPPPAESLTRDPVLVCPAQFGTAEDYAELVEALEARGHPVVVTPLKFTDWLRLIPASLTSECASTHASSNSSVLTRLTTRITTPESTHGTDACSPLSTAHRGRPLLSAAGLSRPSHGYSLMPRRRGRVGRRVGRALLSL